MKKLCGNILLILIVAALSGAASAGQRRKYPPFNEIGVDLPLDGGGMLMASRLWSFGRHMRAGFVVGGGVIEREFDLDGPGLTGWEGETKALVLPYFGPRVTVFFHVIGLSLGYGAYYAKTDFDVKSPGGTTALSGETKGWGTGFYAPFLVVDFYSKKHDMLFGLGIGGFLGSSYPELEAVSPGLRITSSESPLDTLTLHFRTTWSDWRRPMSRRNRDLDDEF